MQISKNGYNSSNMYYRQLRLLEEICSIKNVTKHIRSLFLKIKLWKREY
jgi:hypothetical protein